VIDRNKFFAGVRSGVFRGHLAQKQVDGQNVILDAWDASDFTDLRWLAYMLGTTFHETASTMQPIHEYGSDAYFARMYDITGDRPEVARRLGNTERGDGIKYCGRGLVQLTGKSNYQRLGGLVGQDLVSSPDLAMNPEVAVKIMFIGMTGQPHDTFSGVNLQKFFNDSTEDWVGARHVINGQDHAELIASTAKAFYAALEVLPDPAPIPDPVPVPEPPETPEMQMLKKIWARLQSSGFAEETQLDRIEANQAKQATLANQEKIMAVMDDLEAKVAVLETTDASAIALLQGLSQALKDAVAAGDMSRVQAVVDKLDADNTKLAAAVTANTPAA
jgi:putative chitinase